MEQESVEPPLDLLPPTSDATEVCETSAVVYEVETPSAEASGTDVCEASVGVDEVVVPHSVAADPAVCETSAVVDEVETKFVTIKVELPDKEIRIIKKCLYLRVRDVIDWIRDEYDLVYGCLKVGDIMLKPKSCKLGDLVSHSEKDLRFVEGKGMPYWNTDKQSRYIYIETPDGEVYRKRFSRELDLATLLSTVQSSFRCFENDGKITLNGEEIEDLDAFVKDVPPGELRVVDLKYEDFDDQRIDIGDAKRQMLRDVYRDVLSKTIDEKKRKAEDSKSDEDVPFRPQRRRRLNAEGEDIDADLNSMADYFDVEENPNLKEDQEWQQFLAYFRSLPAAKILYPPNWLTRSALLKSQQRLKMKEYLDELAKKKDGDKQQESESSEGDDTYYGVDSEDDEIGNLVKDDDLVSKADASPHPDEVSPAVHGIVIDSLPEAVIVESLEES